MREVHKPRMDEQLAAASDAVESVDFTASKKRLSKAEKREQRREQHKAKQKVKRAQHKERQKEKTKLLREQGETVARRIRKWNPNEFAGSAIIDCGFDEQLTRAVSVRVRARVTQ